MSKIREIQHADLPDIVRLLGEGFPRKTPQYWENALEVMRGRPRCGDLPVYGLAIEGEGALQGVMLMIGSEKDGNRFCNLSSWYVRPDYRKFSALLFQRALRARDVSFTDCSPAPHVLPIITKFGFRPYSCGTRLIDPRAALRSGGGRVSALGGADRGTLDPDTWDRIERHLAYGCQGFLVEDRNRGPVPVLYRTVRLKRLIPAARFVHGEPDLLAANAGGILRRLMGRGILLMLVDLPCGPASGPGRILPEYAVRYVRGAQAPGIGDLLDTEVAIFGL